MDLVGKTAVVTGSSRGLGRHYALLLAEAGANVVIHDINEQAAAAFGEAPSGEAVADEIRALGRTAAFLTADLTDASSVAEFYEKVIATFGKVDILVNNAGGDIGATTPRPNPNDALDIHPDDIKSVVERNMLSAMYMCKYFGSHMRENKSGKIVNVGSVAGHVPVREGIIYAAAKTAISHYTRCLAEELRPFDVNVNAIAPAATYTGRFLATRSVENEAGKSRLQRIAHPQDMGNIVLFLCGPQADYLTGETIVCWH